MRTHGQDCIEQKNALLCPWGQIPVVRNRAAEVTVQFLINIDQGRRNADPLMYRKTQTVGLTRPVIGILSENNDFHLFQRCKIERIENITARRVNNMRPVLMNDRLIKLCIIRLAELRLKSRLPFTCDCHVLSLFSSEINRSPKFSKHYS